MGPISNTHRKSSKKELKLNKKLQLHNSKAFLCVIFDGNRKHLTDKKLLHMESPKKGDTS